LPQKPARFDERLAKATMPFARRDQIEKITMFARRSILLMLNST
jgi:hypothetical protein